MDNAKAGFEVFVTLLKTALAQASEQGILAVIFLAITELAFPKFFEKRRIQPRAPKFSVIGHELLHSSITLMSGGIIRKVIQELTENGSVVFLTLGDLSSEDDEPWLMVGFLARMAVEVAVYFLVFDAVFYFGHRLLHTKYLYKMIHKSHHVSKAPNAVAGYSFNPIEGVGFGMFLPLFCWMATQCIGGILKASVITCGFIQVIQSLAIHSGYELVGPTHFESPIRAFFLTPTFHDRHHEHPNCNFSGFFTWLDDAFGTADENWRAKYASWRRHLRKDDKMA